MQLLHSYEVDEDNDLQIQLTGYVQRKKRGGVTI